MRQEEGAQILEAAASPRAVLVGLVATLPVTGWEMSALRWRFGFRHPMTPAEPAQMSELAEHLLGWESLLPSR